MSDALENATGKRVASEGVGSERGRELGAFLRSARSESGVHLTEISRQTRIPMRSLELLEAGDFDRLPADIFVRGFLRSYADCVGLDRAELLGKYSDLGRSAPPLSSDLLGASRDKRAKREDAPLLPTPGGDGQALDRRLDRRLDQRLESRRRTILPELSESDREGRRGPVTVAVIILVIVATLTMSYLLRRPSADSDGFTRAEQPTERVV